MHTVLTIDDEASIRAAIRRAFPEYEVLEAADAETGLQLVASHSPDIVLLDMKLADRDGLELLPVIRRGVDAPSVIVITAYGNVRTTVEALRAGAYDFVEKPFDIEALGVTIRNALELRGLKDEVGELRARVAKLVGEGEGLLLGNETSISKLRSRIDRLAAVDLPVLILGASGTGKELVARSLHQRGPRKTKPFVVVNCAALPDTLIESELFGHEKGAFTGAHSRFRGRFERAGSGTIFLDEIGDLKSGLQAKLLRVLEDGRFERVGGSTQVQCNARVLAATNRDLDVERRQGRFRDDLFFRLSAGVLRLPLLADRRGDIPLLARHFLQRQREKLRSGPATIAEPAMDALLGYDWPGNIRELRNAMERASLLAEGEEIELEDLPQSILQQRESSAAPAICAESLRDQVEAFEAEVVQSTLARMDGNRRRTALALGISLRSLQYKLSRMRPPRSPKT